MDGFHVRSQEALTAKELETMKFANTFSDIRFGQLINGLTEFYKDFRNTSVHVGDAIFYVRDQTIGTDSKMLDTELTNLCRQAASPDYD